jgi:hypothetical protein
MFYVEDFERYMDANADDMIFEYDKYLQKCLCKCDECVCKEEEWHLEVEEWMYALWENEDEYFDETYEECL